MKPSISAPSQSFNLRKGLIVFQLMAALLLLSSTFLIFKQVFFLKAQDLGIDMEHILVVNGPRVIIDSDKQALESKMKSFKNSVLSHHTISGVAGGGQVPGKGYNWSGNMRKAGDPEYEAKEVNAVYVDKNFTETYGFNFIAGNNFNKGNKSFDEVIINKEAIKHFGFKAPQDAIGEQLAVNDNYKLTVVGVIDDFHWSSLRETHRPVLFVNEDLYNAYFSVKINTSEIRESIAHVEKTYQAHFPDDPFNYYFLDEAFNRLYQADLQFGNLFSAFSTLAVFIACLGLFALVSFSANLRAKEIGIRKVLGASIGNLMLLLSREFIMLLIIANILAVPIIIFCGKAWLNNYAYKVGIGLEIFLFPGTVLLIISALTISYRTFETAKKNPVETLKIE